MVSRTELLNEEEEEEEEAGQFLNQLGPNKKSLSFKI